MFVRELQSGDVVLLREGVRIEIRGIIQGSEVGPDQEEPVAYVFDTSGKQWTLHPGHVVQLVRRPWPENEFSEANPVGFAQAMVVQALCEQGFQEMDSRGNLDRRLTAIHKALEVYFLGKPPEAQSKPTLVDRHMTP